MFRHQNVLCFSPSDLTRYMQSPFASWMDRFALECSDATPDKDPEDALNTALAKKGYVHEDALEAEFRARGLEVVKIEGGSNVEKESATIAALKSGADVVAQGRLSLAPFAGYSDFLVRVAGNSALGDFHYEVWDAKLSSKVKPMYLVQLCCYAEMLANIQGFKPALVTVALGSGKQETFRTIDYEAYYQSLKQQFLNAQLHFDPLQQPDPADSASWGQWSNYAQSILLERDHLSQVAKITKGQIKKLEQAEVSTMHDLAKTAKTHIKGISPEVLARLKSQAGMQVKTLAAQTQDSDAAPCYAVIKPDADQKLGLALLPAHSANDVFFDIEGYPLDDGGLEYLWGVTYFNEAGGRDFIDFWAHNPAQEKQTFIDFITWVYARWQQDPSMHIYHYASYEITACRKLMGRYGVCEHEVDQLLRNEVFVDLYKIVNHGILLGEDSYSIKKVEHLYRGKRDTEVANGGESVEVYERWRERNAAGEEGDTWQTSAILKSIREYNIDDCDSTQELVDWLRVQQAEHHIVYQGRTEVIEDELSDEVTERTALRDRLLAKAAQEDKSDTERAALTQNMAWMLEFHRRESKPTWWRLFDRLGMSHVELQDDLDCLANCQRTERAAFKLAPRDRNLAYEYSFDTNQEFKGNAKSYYLLGVETEDGKTVTVKALSDESDIENGLIVVKSNVEPDAVITLVPDEYVRPDPIPAAIELSVQDYEKGELVTQHGEPHQSAIVDFLMRAKPRFKAAFKPKADGAIVESADPQERLKQVINAIQHLDHSYLPIQGPPGAGKSYTGKHVIAELLKNGAKVGIASNSHKAINNLLLSTASYCKDNNINAVFACTKDTDEQLATLDVNIVKNADLADLAEGTCVLGTTAWGFAREDMAGQLDYLFIDEAGQVAVANLIAMSRATKNLILMGDQMQLGQPSQGSHPADSGLSVLDYLLRDNPTIPADMGVFLGTTYRMHSKVNRFISDHIYEGKLQADSSNDQRFIEVPDKYLAQTPEGPLNQTAGIVYAPVMHEGNTQASDEEVEAIAEMAQACLGRVFHTGETTKPTRKITWDDMLFVAPYNHQVSKLKQALGEKAKVGSVDKFQGQEAPIVFLSMCASDPADSPRGLDFLFDKHRINVAISRAQCLAVVVANPAIGQVAVNNVAQLKLVNLFNALTQYAG